nr:hypothetical protein [Bacillus licheniformis]
MLKRMYRSKLSILAVSLVMMASIFLPSFQASAQTTKTESVYRPSRERFLVFGDNRRQQTGVVVLGY